MSMDLIELVSVLENEIVVGEALYCNVEAQKKSIVLCDIENLLEQIEAREPWLRSLSQLEEKRSEILRRISSPNAATMVRLSLGGQPRCSIVGRNRIFAAGCGGNRSNLRDLHGRSRFYGAGHHF